MSSLHLVTFFYVFYSCLCGFLLVGNCTAEEISVALSSKIVDCAPAGDLSPISVDWNNKCMRYNIIAHTLIIIHAHWFNRTSLTIIPNK